MKSIQCGICDKPVEQSVLFQHLVNSHRWKEIVTPAPASPKAAPQSKAQPKQTRCPGCHVLFESKAAYKRHRNACQHVNAANSKETVPASSTSPAARICPYCNISVSARKFGKHIRSKCPKRKDAHQVNKAGSEFYTDPAIEKYLAQHPEPPKIGKFGVPQAKFKYSTYGRSGMEYDTWSKS
ncbi:hypothetical protein [Klebsiella aerogenes]|uniref:hypothetical protein n=1 Tax=Klebsiella aerogenes TaxID=548 RepID=UPI00351D35FB